jgi:hypothetical protein
MKLVMSVVAAALLVGAGGVARAQLPPAQSPSLGEMQQLAQQHLQLEEPQMLAHPAPPPTPEFWQGELPPDSVLPRLEQRTALLTGRNKLALGILAFSYGITDWLQVGSAPPFWALRTVTSVLVPNAYVKVAPVRRSGLWVAGNAAFFFAALSSDNQATGQLFVVPLSAFVSVKPLDKFWIHGEGTYVFAHLDGTGNYRRLTLDGTATTQAAQLGLMFQYQLSRVVSLTLWGRYEPYTKAISVDGSGPIGDNGFATVQGRVLPWNDHPWAVVPGVACLWTHVRFTLGAGYGTYFLPEMDLPVRGAGFVPDASFYVVL